MRFPKDQKRKEFWNRMPLFSFTFMQCPLTIKFFGASSWALLKKSNLLLAIAVGKGELEKENEAVPLSREDTNSMHDFAISSISSCPKLA